MPWRYGVVRFRHKQNPDFRFYGIGEIYFDKDPLKPYACTMGPTEPYSEGDDESISGSPDSIAKSEIKMILKKMIKACDKYPVFDVDGPFEKFPEDDVESEKETATKELEGSS